MHNEFLSYIVGQLEVAFEHAYVVASEKLRCQELEVQLQLNATLDREKQAAESHSKMKSEFLATMSHEIRTPMNAIVGMTSLLADQALSHEQKQIISVIQKGSHDLLTILNDILDFSKIESGNLKLEEEPFNLRSTIEGVLDFVSRTAETKGILLNLFLDPNLPHLVVGDATRLRQILNNLISNAIKFTDTGDIVVIVSASNQALPIYFNVIDTGVGIPSDSMGKLFKKFSQVSTGISRRYGGTGLGLAICCRLVEVQGGAMWVRSVHHKGSSFAFMLNLKCAPEGAVEKVDTVGYGSTKSFNSDVPSSVVRWILSFRVLVVDDNAVNRMVVAKLLERVGVTSIHAVSDGKEAVEWIQKQRGPRHTLVLMDVAMPGMDGLTATREIQATVKKPPWIVALTASAMEDDRLTCLQSGMNDFVAKPVTKHSLVQMLERYVVATFGEKGE
ncbi:putative histidine kinase sensor/regulator [Cladochytrium replicatum]|nr:putative histidine kinase sensor/regulator [Cladochytrium replicatum]